MKKAMEELAYVDKKTGEKKIFLGNFLGWCSQNRSFNSFLMRIQMDIHACLMGTSFWRRHAKMRRERFGVSNLNMCLKDVNIPYANVTKVSQSEMQKKLFGQTTSTKRGQDEAADEGEGNADKEDKEDKADDEEGDKEEEVRWDEERRTAGAKRQQKYYTAFLHF